MDIVLALTAYLYPKIGLNLTIGMILALMVYRLSNVEKFNLKGEFYEDSLLALILALILTVSTIFGLIPPYTAFPAVFLSSFRQRLPYYFLMPVYFILGLAYLSYIPSPWNPEMIVLISLTMALASTLIIYASKTTLSIPLILLNTSILIAFEIYRLEVSEVELSAGFILAFILSLLAYRAGVADETGLMSATITGMLVIVSADIRLYFILLLFYFVGSAVTKYRYAEKARLGIGEPAGGARGYVNVFANSLPALFFALNYGYLRDDVFLTAFVASVATALGDTMASEIGKTAERVYLITSLERVKPGTSGGVSVKGEISALAGVMIIAMASFLMGIIDIKAMMVSAVAGFIGVHIDSLLGATLEKRGVLNNAGVNFFATLLSGLLCYQLLL